MTAGKMTPRMKMISLMYLVFIAMLAMNMSKEVLVGFGLINEKLVDSSAVLEEKTGKAVEHLKVKASEAPDQFAEVKDKAVKLAEYSQKLYDYLESVKEILYKNKTKEERTDYMAMDKSTGFDEKFFEGSRDRKKFLTNIRDYVEGVKSLIEKNYPELFEQINKDFDVNSKIKDREGVKIAYMDYHFMGFPLISTITKLSFLQNNVRNVQNEILSKFLSGQLSRIASMDNYTTLLELERTVFYSGQIFDGSIVLGRKDASTKPNRVELKLGSRRISESEYTIEDGKVKLNVRTGAPGDYPITGKLVFLQKGKEIVVPVKSMLTVISKPNQAVISAEKMNVVYRGVENPITISLPGVASNKLKVSAPGLIKKGGMYLIKPGKGRTVKVVVSAIIEGGIKVTSDKIFRIKDIPRPTGTVSGQSQNLKLPVSNLAIATVGAILEDFDFELSLKINSFKVSVPGQPSITVKGSNKMSKKAQSLLKRAKRGDLVQIFDINVSIRGNTSYKLKKVSSVIVEVR